MDIDAMSGDEADHRQGNPRYIKKKWAWRNESEVDPFVHTLSCLHLATRFNPDGSAGRGAFPHVRISGTAREPEPGKPQPRLPRNFYARSWLKSLQPAERDALEMQPSVPLTFSPYIARQVSVKYHLSPT